MPVTETTRVDTTVRALGTLSICSGLSMLCVPATMSNVYALPKQKGLVRLLGARDVAIGALLLQEDKQRLGLKLRMAADAFDGFLIAGRMAVTHTGDTRAALRLVGALALSLVSSRLSNAESEDP
jgi:hypothetical protein